MFDSIMTMRGLNPFALLAAFLVACLAAGFAEPARAQDATSCDGSVKTKIVGALADAAKLTETEQLALQASLYQQYAACGVNDAKALPTTDPFFAAVKQCGASATKRGSLFYEEMSCCGYDPQRRTFACPIKVKQRFGFGAAPLPGSREYVYNCVKDASGNFVPVGYDSVHLSDSIDSPTWQFAVVANATQNLNAVQPQSGATRTARSILSWNFRPTGCYYQPIWGVAIDYRIRLDQ